MPAGTPNNAKTVNARRGVIGMIQRVMMSSGPALLAEAKAETAAQATSFGGFARPEGLLPYPVNTADVGFKTREFGSGVYPLVSTRLSANNSGFSIGEKGVPVADASNLLMESCHE